MKYCKDCKHQMDIFCKKRFIHHKFTDGGDVYGLCILHRERGQMCGQNADQFEPSMWYKIKQYLKGFFK